MSEGEDEEAQLRLVALQNARVILAERRRAEAELRATKTALEEEMRLLEQLNRIGAAVASNLDLEATVQAVTDAGTELTGAQFGAFFYTVTDEHGDKFLLYTLSGAPREAFEKFGHPRSTPLFGPTFRGDRVVRSGNIKEDPAYGQWGPHYGMPAGHLPVTSYLAVPVVTRTGETIGGLFFAHQQPDMFDERTERAAKTLAAQGAIAIDNARVYDEARRSADAERAARAELQRVSMLKDEFLATLSHELRTPLNAVLGWAELLLTVQHEEADRRRGLETIVRNTRAQAQIVDDLLDMNRIVSGKLRLDVQRIDLGSIVEAAVESVRPSAEAKSIRLRALLDPKAGPALGDPNRLQQVVWNLLTNAVKFTPKEGRIDVVLARVNSHLEIQVTDTGIGIAPDFLPHVFERFRQADASTTRTYAGLGLGLSIVKQLVELHGGTVTVSSPGVGRGSTFTVHLPLRVVDSATGREHPTSSMRSTAGDDQVVLAGLTVLIVDDEPDAREMLAAVLAGSEAKVLLAASADDGLTLLRAERPDVLVSDIGMPGKDGYQLMRELRRLPADQGGRTPAVALTAFARSEDRTRALLVGYQVHLAKPIEPHELVVTIASLAGRTGVAG
jgi:signal transduction histidine kinase/ActR/RegA family two-component response regulator